MRRKVAAAFLAALVSVVAWNLIYVYLVGPSVPGPFQGLFMVTFAIWIVYMMAMLLKTVTRPGDDLSKAARRP